MPWGSSFFPLLIVSSSTGFTGLFVYSPAPGAGNLVDSITSHNGTDPYGNNFVEGIASYGPGGAPILQMDASGLVGQLVTDVFHAHLSLLAPTGGTSGVPSWLLVSGSDVNSVTNDSQALVGVTGRSSDATVGPYVILGSIQQGSSNIQTVPVFAVGGGLVYSAPGVAGGLLVAETLHAVSFVNSWTQSAGRTTTGYRLLPTSNELEVVGSVVVPAGFVANQNITSGATSAYFPAHLASLTGWDTTNNLPVRLAWLTSGLLQFNGPVANTAVGHTIDIPAQRVNLTA